MTESALEKLSPVPTTEQCASGAVECKYTTLKAHLIVRKTPQIPKRRHVYLYDVIFEGEMVVTGSPDPEPDLARILLARGVTGKITVFDGNKPRTIVNIEKAAKVRTAETADRRSRFVPYVEGEHD